MVKQTKTNKKTKETKTSAKKTKKTPIAPKETKTKSAVKKVKETKKKAPTIVQEENNYARTLIAGVLIIIIFIGGFIAVKYRENLLLNEEKYVATADEKKFKEEYESINDTTRSNGIKNKKISIIEDNNIKYITIDEAATMLDSGSGIIYFGFSACPWSRNAVPILLKAMQSSELDTIYYVNIRPEDKIDNDIRDFYILNSKNKARKSKEAASESYYNVLLALANELEDYILTTEKGKEVNIGEKRLNTPTVAAVKNGVLVGFHEGTVKDAKEDEDGKVSDLTKDQEKELLNTYSNIISKYLDDTCEEDQEGC